jgi:hypothetical protein
MQLSWGVVTFCGAQGEAVKGSMSSIFSLHALFSYSVCWLLFEINFQPLPGTDKVTGDVW